MDSTGSKPVAAVSDCACCLERRRVPGGKLMVTASRASCEFLRDRNDFGESFSLRFPPPLKKFPGKKSGRPEEEEEEEDDDDEDDEDDEEAPSILSR